MTNTTKLTKHKSINRRKHPTDTATTSKHAAIKHTLTKRRRVIDHPPLAQLFVGFSLVALTVTTVCWAVFGASLERFNADQLVDAYLFENAETFQGALFPGAHTMLLKWPVFWLIKLLGNTPDAFLAVTVILCVTTVGMLVYLISKIEKRPYVFGTICLALASILLLVPAQAYAGALLPVNMAMVTTRNIEYVLYVWCIYWAVRATRWRSRYTWAALGGLIILIASDKIFAVLSVGCGLLAAALYALFRRWDTTKRMLRWLAISIAATVGASLLLTALSVLNITNVVNDTSVSPFTMTVNPRDIVLGVVYLFGAILTNFGANPASDVIIVRDVPHTFWARLHDQSAAAYIVNLLAAIGLIGLSVKLIFSSLKSPQHGTKNEQQTWLDVAIILVFSTITAAGAFVFTKHYYAVDARYISVILFAAIIAGTVMLSQLRVKRRPFAAAIICLMAVIPIGYAHVYAAYLQNKAAYIERDQRNRTIATTLTQRKSNLIVGDYWLTVPLKTYLDPKLLQVSPTSSCTKPSGVLSSRAWQPDLQNRPFAFLASKDATADTYGGCKLDEIIEAYGKPNETVTVAGDPKKPDEMLLFYDQGIQRVATEAVSKVIKSILPTPIDQISPSDCPNGTILNVVAHQDDDLLFMNPDTHRALEAGKCVRVVFLTAGDAGGDQSYWYARETGAKNAYATLRRAPNIWNQRDVTINGRYISIATLHDFPRLKLIFLRLPDGNIDGSGFALHGNGSLAQLAHDKTATVDTVDNRSSYTYADTVATLLELMKLYKPNEIRSQSPIDPSDRIHDHSDHLETGRITEAAYQAYGDRANVAFTTYLGYSIQELSPNLDQGPELATKLESFWAYANFDGAVCNSEQACDATVYGKYLVRQYRTPEPSSVQP